LAEAVEVVERKEGISAVVVVVQDISQQEQYHPVLIL
jgi:hypothetical protein